MAITDTIQSQSDEIQALLHTIEEGVQELISLADSSAGELTSTAPHPVSASSRYPKTAPKKVRQHTKPKGVLKLSPLSSRRHTEPLGSVRLPPLKSRHTDQTELPKLAPLPSCRRTKPTVKTQHSDGTVISHLRETDVTNLLSHYSLRICEAMRRCTLWSLSHFLDTMTSQESSNNQSSREIQFSTSFCYKYPDIILEPPIDKIQQIVNHVVQMVLGVSRTLSWWGKPPTGNTPALSDIVVQDDQISSVCQSLQACVSCVSEKVSAQLVSLKQYEFLWSGEMQRTFNAFLQDRPDTESCIKHLETLLRLENEVRLFGDL